MKNKQYRVIKKTSTATTQQKANYKARYQGLLQASGMLASQGLGGGNATLIEMYSREEGTSEFKTFQQWKKAGYMIKKGSKGFDIWGSPREEQRTLQHKKTGKVKVEAVEFYPLAVVFSAKQVEKMKAKKS